MSDVRKMIWILPLPANWIKPQNQIYTTSLSCLYWDLSADMIYGRVLDCSSYLDPGHSHRYGWPTSKVHYDINWLITSPLSSTYTLSPLISDDSPQLFFYPRRSLHFLRCVYSLSAGTITKRNQSHSQVVINCRRHKFSVDGTCLRSQQNLH